MARLLKTRLSKTQQETPKPNLLKRFGGKLKSAFLKKKTFLKKKKQSPIPESNAINLQDAQLDKATLRIPIAEEVDRPSTEDTSGMVPTHVGVDKEFEIPDNTTQGHTAIAPLSPRVSPPRLTSQDGQPEVPLQGTVGFAISTSETPTTPSSSGFSLSTSTGLDTDRRRVLRSNSFPPSPSLPTTGASSGTLCNTPCHSGVSLSHSLVELRHFLDRRRESIKECQSELAEHLKSEQAENENTEWAALVAWIEASHRIELDTLKKDHAAQHEKLHQERSEARRRLEMRNRELRAIKREIKDLKKSTENYHKDEEGVPPAHQPQSIEAFDAESVDLEEGGVTIISNNFALVEQVEYVRGNTLVAPQETTEVDHPLRVDNEGTKQATAFKKETAEEKRNLQQALRQKLMEDSIAEVLVKVEPEHPAAVEKYAGVSSQKAISIQGHSKESFTDIKDLQDHNTALQTSLKFTREVIHNMQMEAELKEEEITRLKAENHFAQLEVGHCNGANACYRDVLENENPARTAHLDGLLKRKDEAYDELEERAAECAEQLAEEKKQRAVENVHAEAKVQGMKKDLAYRSNLIEALTEGKKVLKEQNDWVFQMFQGKIFHGDIINVFLRDYDAIQKDNALLIKKDDQRTPMLHSRRRESSSRSKGREDCK